MGRPIKNRVSPSYFGDAIPWIIGSGRAKGVNIYLESPLTPSPANFRAYAATKNIGTSTDDLFHKVAPAAIAFCLAPASGSATLRAIIVGTQKVTDTANALVRMSAALTPAWTEYIDGYGSHIDHPSIPAGVWGMVLAQSSTPWSFLTGGPLDGSAWRGLVHYRTDKLVLDDQGKVPLYEAILAMPGVDAEGFVRPDAALKELLGNPLGGLGMAAADIITDVGPDGTYASSWACWLDNHPEFCKVARTLTDPSQLWTYVEELLDAGWADWFWTTDDKLKVVPRDDTAKGTFVPASAAIVIDTRHTVGTNPIRRVDVPEREKFNVWKIQFKDAARDFADGHAEWKDDGAIRRSRARVAPTETNEWVVTQAHAQALATARVRQSLNNRRTYDLTLTTQCLYLEPTNLLLISDGKQLVNQLVKVRKLRLNGNQLEVTATEWVQGNATPLNLTPQTYIENRPLVNTGPAVALANSVGDVQANLITATAQAVDAQATADAKAKVTISASPPSGPSTGDLWYSSDTATNCPDSNCDGHTVDASGAVRTGSYPHRFTPWPHRWSGTAWLDVSGGTGYLAGTPLYNLLSAIDGNPATGYVRLCQNEQPGNRGGAPDVWRLSIYPLYGGYLNSSTSVCRWKYTITPTSGAVPGIDNIDTLKYMRIQVFAATGDTAPIDTIYVTINGRLYKDGGSAAENAVQGEFMWHYYANYISGSPYMPNVYLRATLYNLYGASADLDFTPANVRGASLSKATGTITGAAPSSGGGGGGSGGGGSGGGDKYCPAPWVPIDLADGTRLEAGSLQVGDLVWTRPEDGGVYAAFPVEAVERDEAVIWAANLLAIDNPLDLVSYHYSASHLLEVEGRGWVELQALQPGDVVLGRRPRRVMSTEELGRSPVIKIAIADAHTYETGGLVCHNKNWV
jgi:hypothetical protein